ncbi:polyprenyl synthetase family protein [Agrococcus carbonis]|uniref:Geranylgeranyl diphosphate synthase, type II n=1 Tax=Agrococcus carbonis TaxID=684552 RepID=A0A1H1P193_9MICO|nr:polyprenyl synthetase family protein [Agrococcus carbonis]SDS05036.1 geranylgeranyl diphosphate synthase, type II [Agrococcus carbonis]
MTAVEAPSALAEVERRISELLDAADAHTVHEAAQRACVGGKLLRPRLLIAAAGEDAPRDLVVRASAAIELIHAALLVHDDVIDHDDERRGEPTVASWAARGARSTGSSAGRAARIGLATAIVSGDVLLVRGVAELARLDLDDEPRRRVLTIVERAMVRAAEGEHDDVVLAGGSPHEEQIELLLERKTAEYSFRAPLELGAVIAGRPAEAVAALADVGLRMGVLYQLRDDVLGIFGDEAVTGKSALSDIRAGAPTLLATLASRDPAWQRVGGDYGDPAADAGAGSRIRHLMRASGALDEVERRIASGADALRTSIARLPVEQALRDELAGLLERCVERAR